MKKPKNKYNIGEIFILTNEEQEFSFEPPEVNKSYLLITDIVYSTKMKCWCYCYIIANNNKKEAPSMQELSEFEEKYAHAPRRGYVNV